MNCRIIEAANYAVITVVPSTCCFSKDLLLLKCGNEGRGEIRRELAAVVVLAEFVRKECTFAVGTEPGTGVDGKRAS